MFDTIFIGTSGLLNHAKGLRVVGNNLANVNTPGFKSSQLQFANLFEQGGGNTSQSGAENNGSGTGTGLSSLGAKISFRAGLDQGTGNPLDLNINGNGFYAIKRDGEILYTRSGDFRFDDKGILVNSNGDHVMGLDGGGKLVDITVDNLSRNSPKATANVTFSGNLTSTVAVPAVDTTVTGITVLDANGTDQPVSLTFVNAGAGTYNVTVKNAAGTSVGTGTLKFAAGFPTAGFDSITFTHAPAGVTPFAVKLDFSKDVTSLASASTVAVASQDGHIAGVRTDQTIGADGTLTIQYSNGQSATGQRLALADFQSDTALKEAGGSAFRAVSGASVQYGHAGVAAFGSLVAGHREGSNVDLAEEFGNLILMQRGYQASSHVISTANEMIQQLFDMKGNR